MNVPKGLNCQPFPWHFTCRNLKAVSAEGPGCFDEAYLVGHHLRCAVTTHFGKQDGLKAGRRDVGYVRAKKGRFHQLLWPGGGGCHPLHLHTYTEVRRASKWHPVWSNKLSRLGGDLCIKLEYSRFKITLLQYAPFSPLRPSGLGPQILLVLFALLKFEFLRMNLYET